MRPPAVGEHCEQSSPVGRAATAGGSRRGGKFLGPAAGPPPGAVTPETRISGHLPPGLDAATEPVAALLPRKVRSPRPEDGGTVRRIRATPPPDGVGELNSAGGLCGPIRLPLNGFTYS